MASSRSANHILHGLHQEEFAHLEPHLQPVHIARGAVLHEAGRAAPHVYFPETCVLALLGITERGASVEVALVGREGVASVSAAFGRQQMPFRIVAQYEGDAQRISTDIIVAKLRDCRHLYDRLLVYSHSMIAQVGQSAICNRFHTARQRLARWLLMTADRVEADALPLTHEFIAHMVGGPRSAVTEAAAELRASGAIDYRRGVIMIRDLARLRQLACECYTVGNDGGGK